MFSSTSKDHKESGFTPHMKSGDTPPENKTRRTNSCDGFTLLEMLVVLGIFVVMSTIVLVKNQQFNSSILLDSVAYEVALSIRETQVSSQSASEEPGTMEEFDSPHGIAFASPAHTTLPNTEYYRGIDDNENGNLDNFVEFDETFIFKKGFSIAEICGIPSITQVWECGIGKAIITFKRPNPDAIIRKGNGTDLQYVELHIASADGSTTTVSVTNVGQISVD